MEHPQDPHDPKFEDAEDTLFGMTKAKAIGLVVLVLVLLLPLHTLADVYLHAQDSKLEAKNVQLFETVCVNQASNRDAINGIKTAQRFILRSAIADPRLEPATREKFRLALAKLVADLPKIECPRVGK